jgi:hypothetical protein
MPRWHVNIVQMRARDIRVGDVVARDAGRSDGWFRVHEVKALGDGTVNVIDKSNTRSFTAGPFDLVGLQTPVPLPAEADHAVQREHAGRETTGSARTEGLPTQGSAPTPGGTGDAAAREAAARPQASGGARALPGP